MCTCIYMFLHAYMYARIDSCVSVHVVSCIVLRVYPEEYMWTSEHLCMRYICMCLYVPYCNDCVHTVYIYLAKVLTYVWMY